MFPLRPEQAPLASRPATGVSGLSVMRTVTKGQTVHLYLRNFCDVINPNTLLLVVISRLVIVLRSRQHTES
jgi:hypothetical protein